MSSFVLKDYSDELMRRVNAGSQEAILELCNSTVTAAKKLAPVKTGNLRNSIGYKVEKKEGYVYAQADYAPSVEFGKLGRLPKPFMRPAIDQTTKGQRAEKTIANIIKKKVGNLK